MTANVTIRGGFDCALCPARARCFFAGLDGDDVRRFREGRVTNAYRRRQVVFYEGHRPHGVFAVCGGLVKTFKSDTRGHQLTVRVAGPGELLGEHALLAGEPYAETAEALELSSIAFVDADRFRELLDRRPELTRRLLAGLARDVRRAEDKARDMALKPSRERLALELLAVAGEPAAAGARRSPARLPYTRQDLAELAGLAEETVIRLLTELQERGVITLRGRELTITDVRALERLAGAGA